MLERSEADLEAGDIATPPTPAAVAAAATPVQLVTPRAADQLELF